jgi:hypothetical protein
MNPTVGFIHASADKSRIYARDSKNAAGKILWNHFEGSGQKPK